MSHYYMALALGSMLLTTFVFFKAYKPKELTKIENWVDKEEQACIDRLTAAIQKWEPKEELEVAKEGEDTVVLAVDAVTILDVTNS